MLQRRSRRDDFTSRARAMIQRVVRGLLDGPAGHTSQRLRRGIEARAALQSGARERDAGPIRSELTTLVDKITRHAYKVVDEDYAALRATGYTDDELFEITLCAALGAARGRHERALEALEQATRGRDR